MSYVIHSFVIKVQRQRKDDLHNEKNPQDSKISLANWSMGVLIQGQTQDEKLHPGY